MGRESKGFKKRGKLGRGVGALKSQDWNPLMNYGSVIHKYIIEYIQLNTELLK